MVIQKIINVGNPTICENKFTYEVEIKSNDCNLNRLARTLDLKFNNWNFFIEVTIIDGVCELDGFYFYNSLGQRIYLIVGLSPEEWKCVRSYVLMDYTRR